MKKNILAIVIVSLIAVLVFCGCSSGDDKAAGENPRKVYEKISEKVGALSSAEYSAAQLTKINFSEKDQRKTMTSLRVQEVYKEDTMDYKMNVSYKGNTTITNYDVFYTDGVMYSDMTGQKIGEEKTLDEFMSGSMAITNPLMYLQQNSIFKIPAEDMTDLEVSVDEADSDPDGDLDDGDVSDSDGDSDVSDSDGDLDDDGDEDQDLNSENSVTVLSFNIADEKIPDYLRVNIDTEEAIYTEDMNFSDLSVKMSFDEDYLPVQLKVTCDLATTGGEGEIDWVYQFDEFDKLKLIKFPDFSGYKLQK